MYNSIMLEKNPKETWNLLRELVAGKSKEKKCMQFPEPHHKCQHLQQNFCNSRGENVQRRETATSDQWT